MKVAIVGFGLQGQSAYQYWSTLTNDIVICDANEQLTLPPNVQAKLGPDYLEGLSQFDVIVRSPMIHPRQIVQANLATPSVLGLVTTNTNEFMRVCPSRNIIGVTGTKGKGTTSTLLAKMLEADLQSDPATAGRRVHLGGNIGIPPLELLKNDIQPDDWVVLELANFQLIDLKYSPPLAICLMVVPEHMDWHTDMEEYLMAKQQLFRWQGLQDIAVYYADNENSEYVTSISAGHKVPYYQAPGAIVQNDHIVIAGQTICATNELKLLGTHNWQNVCAAVTALWQVSSNAQAARSVLTSFSGLEHRLEFVREVGEVRYYDDSFGTTPETAIVALEAFKEPKVIILGGSDKGADYSALAETVARTQVRHVVCIGQTGPSIAEALEIAGFHDITQLKPSATMRDIVHQVQNLALPGDVVLLSTASASLDMFANYKERGKQFHAAVNNLTAALADASPGEQSPPPAESPAPDQPTAA